MVLPVPDANIIRPLAACIELAVNPTNNSVVRAYMDIVFANCFMVGKIRVIQGPTYPDPDLLGSSKMDIGVHVN